MVHVHPRVTERHPELSEADVASAWRCQYRYAVREGDSGLRRVAVGLDPRGREVEMVAVELDDGAWLVYHAMTPPSAKTYRELRMGGRR